jgi:carbamoyl-phosphate synthase large subunit
MKTKLNVLIAGIGGASLGTEILKSLLLVKERYTIFGCDISPLAFGHYQPGFEQTFLADGQNYIESIVEICRRVHIDCIIPGGEEPLKLLSQSIEQLAKENIRLAANSPSVIEQCTDKSKTFEVLAHLGFQVPITLVIEHPDEFKEMTYPCIIKPAIGSGGSSFVFLAQNREQALLYITYLTKNAKKAIVQEYLPEHEGEFTIGVLSLPNRKVVGSIALKRIFDSKLSVLVKGKTGLISSGYSQGLIDYFPEVCRVAEQIARDIGSEGPINVQGRVKNNRLIPFEINPRFSASTYLRSMAGFNEIDLYLRHLFYGEEVIKTPSIQPGYYLRSLSETFIGIEEIKK